MRKRTGWPRRGAGQGFTLIEVLLATALLLLLLGAAVFSFSSLERGAKLDEGVSQFESLLRFARAHATDCGRQVRVVVDQTEETGSGLAAEKVRLTWEPDPLGNPGVFADLPEVGSYLDRINDSVQVESLRLIGPEAAASLDQADPLDDWLDFLPPIQFHPDGASDAAEIVLISRDEQDKRRVRLRVTGLTGVIKRSLVEEIEPGASNQMANASSDLDNRTRPSAAGEPPATPRSSAGAP
jgi:prepilin-type N-terminal cleavage/methylation domain-containing protein